MIDFQVSQEFKVTRPDGTLYPTEEFHQYGMRLMDALIDLEERHADLADSTTSSDAGTGIVTVELLVTAEGEAVARTKFAEVVSAARSAAGMTDPDHDRDYVSKLWAEDWDSPEDSGA